MSIKTKDLIKFTKLSQLLTGTKTNSVRKDKEIPEIYKKSFDSLMRKLNEWRKENGH